MGVTHIFQKVNAKNLAQSDMEVTAISIGTLAADTYMLTLGGAIVDGSYVNYMASDIYG